MRDKMRHPEILHGEVDVMRVLWGAWAKEIVYDEEADEYSFIGIYDTIHKEKRSDYPFYTDLMVVIAYYAPVAEYGLPFDITLSLINYDASYQLFKQQDTIVVPQGDSPNRWYEWFELQGVGFDNPGQYSLSVLVNNREEHSIPLWVVSPKGVTWDEKRGTKTEFWAEDFKHLREDGRI